MWIFKETSRDDWDYSVMILGGNPFNSFAYGEFKRQLGWNLIRCRCFDGDIITACVSVFYKQVGPAIVCWVPMTFCGDSSQLNKDFLVRLKCALNANFFYFRISFGTECCEISPCFRKSITRIGPTKSLVLEDFKLAESRQSKGWKRNVRRGKRFDVQIRTDRPVDPEEVDRLYRGLESYKGVNLGNSFAEIRSATEQLGDNLFVVQAFDDQGSLLGLRAAIVLGDKAVDFWAVCGYHGRKMYVSYVLLDAMVRYLAASGVEHYDLSGVDEVNNKSVFDFKKGSGARLVEFVGDFEFSNSSILRYLLNGHLFIKAKFDV